MIHYRSSNPHFFESSRDRKRKFQFLIVKGCKQSLFLFDPFLCSSVWLAWISKKKGAQNANTCTNKMITASLMYNSREITEPNAVCSSKYPPLSEAMQTPWQHQTSKIKKENSKLWDLYKTWKYLCNRIFTLKILFF